MALPGVNNSKTIQTHERSYSNDVSNCIQFGTREGLAHAAAKSELVIVSSANCVSTRGSGIVRRDPKMQLSAGQKSARIECSLREKKKETIALMRIAFTPLQLIVA